MFNFIKKIFASNSFHFVLGMGAGLYGLYLVNRVEENKKFDKMLKELEDTLKVMEMKKLAVVKTDETEVKAG